MKLLSGSAEFQPVTLVTQTGQMQSQTFYLTTSDQNYGGIQTAEPSHFHGVPLVNPPGPTIPCHMVSRHWSFPALHSLHVSHYLYYLGCDIHAAISASFTGNYQITGQSQIHHFCRIPVFANLGTQQVKAAVNHWVITDQNWFYWNVILSEEILTWA